MAWKGPRGCLCQNPPPLSPRASLCDFRLGPYSNANTRRRLCIVARRSVIGLTGSHVSEPELLGEEKGAGRGPARPWPGGNSERGGPGRKRQGLARAGSAHRQRTPAPGLRATHGAWLCGKDPRSASSGKAAKQEPSRLI